MIDSEKLEIIKASLLKRRGAIARIAKNANVSRQTVYKCLKGDSRNFNVTIALIEQYRIINDQQKQIRTKMDSLEL